jgi:DNA repair protein RadA/Sms
MAKNKLEFACSECGDTFPKWMGQCPSCSAWNSLQEVIIDNSQPKILQDLQVDTPQPLNQITESSTPRISSGLSEFDKTLGGDNSQNSGLVIGSVVLLGGAPGIGKSTLILQILSLIHQQHTVLYVSGEESKTQIKNRASRLGITSDLLLLSSENLENIITHTKAINPKVLVIDSIQTITSESSSSLAGSVSQVRNCANILTTYAKQSGTILIMVGHVTKDGNLAGPRVLEHMVDTVLSFEGDAAGRYRIIRSVKNRFGAVNEISVFAMLENGLKQVKNPSSIFLTGNKSASGRIVMSIYEGSRPILIELQALVDEGNSKRVCVGVEQNRLNLILAILSKHYDIKTYDKDVFINIVGGVKITETASDLAMLLAIYSSITNIVLPSDLIVFGEVGLTGEVRPVYNAEDRLKEAKKQGFKTAIIPKQNIPKKSLGINIVAIESIDSVGEIIQNL